MVKVTKKRAEELLHQHRYTPRELATLLGTTDAFVMHEVWRGNLKAQRLGDDIVHISRHDALEWLGRREAGLTR